MKKVRPVAVAMVMVMLMTILSSCSSARKADNVVKEDDPWFESTRFQVIPAYSMTDMVGDTKLCAGKDSLFSIYCFSSDGWGSSTAYLDTYDLEGNMTSRQKIYCPELNDFRVMRIYSVGCSSEGETINAAVWFNTGTEHLTAILDIDTRSGAVSNIETINEDTKDGYGIFNVFHIGEYALLIEDRYSSARFEYKLSLYKHNEFVTELDLSAINLRYLLDGISLDAANGSLYVAGYENNDLITMEFDVQNGRLKNKTKFQDADENSINLGEYTATTDGDLCKLDSLGNIIKIDTGSMTPKTMVDTNWYTPFFYPMNTDSYSFDSKILSCSEDRTVIWDRESVEYGSDGNTNRQFIRVLSKADKNPHAGKKIIELALSPDSGVSEYLAKAIYEFNRTDNEYLIRVWDKYKTGFNMGRTWTDLDKNEEKVYQMIQDLRSSDAPDIAIGIQKNSAMRDDIFMDLSNFLDPEVMEKQYSNIFEAGRISGKLYFLPVTLEIEGLVTNEELLKDDAVGITFEEFEELIENDMNGFSPYDYTYSDFYNKRAFVLSCIDTKRAIDGDNIDFGTEQFRLAAEYAKENFTYDDELSVPVEFSTDWNRPRGECYYAKIDDYLDYVHACYKEKGRYRIIGTPSVDASGPRFKALETVSVSVTTDVEAGCKKFLNYLFSGSAYKPGECVFRQIVTNRDIMEQDVDNLTIKNNEKYDIYLSNVKSGAFRPSAGYDRVYGDKTATDEMRDIFLDSLSTISTYYYEDYSIVQFTMEELAPYYAGDRTLDEVIDVLNSRVTKYVKER